MRQDVVRTARDDRTSLGRKVPIPRNDAGEILRNPRGERAFEDRSAFGGHGLRLVCLFSF
eukprot:SAG22_NODE_7172_length_767_cov_5.133234_2_plen_60_part_00